MPTDNEPVEFSVESTVLTPRTLKYLLFKKHLRAVAKLTERVIEIEDALVEPDVIVNHNNSLEPPVGR